MLDDAELLRRFTHENSEKAFAELVHRHLQLVYAAALRHLGGDTHLARDVAQMVFVNLARQAPRLDRRDSVAGWLHTDTRFRASSMARAERRRRDRETKAALIGVEMEDQVETASWNDLRAVLDEALGALSDSDRSAILLRYLQGLSYAELAVQLNLSESAARSRADRALEKLRKNLGHRGIVSTAAAIAAQLPNGVVAEVPAGLANAAIAAALSPAVIGSAATAASATLFSTLLAMKTTSVVLAASLFANALLVGSLYWPVAWTSAAVKSSSALVSPPSQRGHPHTALPAAIVESLSRPSEIVTDPRRIIAEMRSDGFSEGLIHTAIWATVLSKYQIPPEVFEGTVPPKSRWNLTPPRTAEAEARLREYQDVQQRELNFLGYTIPTKGATAAGLSREKAWALSSIEYDYQQILSATYEDFGPRVSVVDESVQNLILREYERDIRATLSPEEAELYLPYSPHSGLLQRQAIQEAGNPMQGLVEVAAKSRASIGDEKFLTLIARFDDNAAAADPIYRQAGLEAGTRADLFLAAYQALVVISNAMAEERPAMAAEAYRKLTAGAGLTAKQRSDFDKTKLGVLLLRAGGITLSPPSP